MSLHASTTGNSVTYWLHWICINDNSNLLGETVELEISIPPLPRCGMTCCWTAVSMSRRYYGHHYDHLHADFDGLASMVAARKLYPGAVLLFPGGTQETV